MGVEGSGLEVIVSLVDYNFRDDEIIKGKFIFWSCIYRLDEFNWWYVCFIFCKNKKFIIYIRFFFIMFMFFDCRDLSRFFLEIKSKDYLKYDFREMFYCGLVKYKL